MNKDLLAEGKAVAVAGVSSDEGKWGNKTFKKLLDKGCRTYPINPAIREIYGRKCFASLSELPEIPGLVVVVVKPETAVGVLGECIELGIKNLWFQPGSGSAEAKKLAEENGLNAVFDACILIERLGGLND